MSVCSRDTADSCCWTWRHFLTPLSGPQVVFLRWQLWFCWFCHTAAV